MWDGEDKNGHAREKTICSQLCIDSYVKVAHVMLGFGREGFHRMLYMRRFNSIIIISVEQKIGTFSQRIFTCSAVSVGTAFGQLRICVHVREKVTFWRGID